MIRLAPSMLSADFSNLREEVKKIETAGAHYLHLDIMDGHFVPNITFGAPVISCLRPYSDMIFDVHLMIENPEKYLEDFAKAGADILNVHIETCPNISDTIKMIRELGKKVGITIKPDTGVKEIKDYLSEVDMVLVMTVYPGFSGQKLIHEALGKVKVLSDIRKTNGYNFDIQVDGGIDLANVREVLYTGADIIVAGSAVFGKDDAGKETGRFLEIFKEYE